MIQPQELRLGNKIIRIDNLGNEKEITVTPSTFSEMEVKCGVTYKPIPLNEEWLLKLGCKDGYFGKGKVYRLIIDLGIIEFSSYCSNKNASGLLITRIDLEVHIFQNIVFALTGEELTLKP